MAEAAAPCSEDGENVRFASLKLSPLCASLAEPTCWRPSCARPRPSGPRCAAASTVARSSSSASTARRVRCAFAQQRRAAAAVGAGGGAGASAVGAAAADGRVARQQPLPAAVGGVPAHADGAMGAAPAREARGALAASPGPHRRRLFGARDPGGRSSRRLFDLLRRLLHRRRRRCDGDNDGDGGGADTVGQPIELQVPNRGGRPRLPGEPRRQAADGLDGARAAVGVETLVCRLAAGP